MSRSKTKPTASIRPWAAIILAVDTAANSGWAIYVRGVLVASGEAKITARVDLERICAAAVQALPGAPVVLVLEKPWNSGHASAIRGLGAARFAWVQAWAAAGGQASKVVSVLPVTWRSRVLGVTRDTAQRERLFALERLRELHGDAGVPAGKPGPDEAAAIGIGAWASRAGEVGAKLPKKARAAA